MASKKSGFQSASRIPQGVCVWLKRRIGGDYEYEEEREERKNKEEQRADELGPESNIILFPTELCCR